MARLTTKGLKRRPPTKKPRLRILIVCEGERTEVLYFGLFVRRLQASNVRLEIHGNQCGSDPQSVVEYARELVTEDKGIDLCYCVIDRDLHPIGRFDTAISIGAALDDRIGHKRIFDVVVSYPCIEYWFLLHFEYRRSPFTTEAGRSPAACALRDLKRFLPDYDKSCQQAISSLMRLTETALINADKSNADAEKTGELNPSTGVPRLIRRVIAES